MLINTYNDSHLALALVDHFVHAAMAAHAYLKPNKNLILSEQIIVLIKEPKTIVAPFPFWGAPSRMNFTDVVSARRVGPNGPALQPGHAPVL